MDLNHDGTVTSEEDSAWRREHPAGMPITPQPSPSPADDTLANTAAGR